MMDLIEVNGFVYAAILVGGCAVALIYYGSRAWWSGHICHLCFGSVTKKRVENDEWIGDEYSCSGCGITYIALLSRKNPVEKDRAKNHS